MTKTLDYYDTHAKEFAAGTRDVDFSDTQKKFAAFLKKPARILDLGCGSGRDAKAFLEMGFDVDAMDGSAAMCKAASVYIGKPVLHQTFSEFHAQKPYDGIWACASLLHASDDELHSLLDEIARALKPGGIFYCSFKYGSFCGYRHERFFTDYTFDSFQALMQKHPQLQILELWKTGDVRKERASELWLNALLIKD